MRSLVFIFVLCVTFGTFSQQRKDRYIGVDYNYGSIIKHNSRVDYLIRAHPAGVMLTYNERTHGDKRWHQEYGYPEWGVSLVYQDFNNEVIGANYNVNIHYSFYFLKRKLQLQVGQGLNYNTNPFDIQNNVKNISYGSHITSSFQLGLQYVASRLFDNFGMRGGFLLFHHSNGGSKAPNTGINVFSASMGITYDFSKKVIAHNEWVDYEPLVAPIKYNFVIRGGINSSDVVGLGQHPFYVISAFADKRISFKNTLQIGVDFIVSEFIKSHQEYYAAAFPDKEIDVNADYKRAAVFVGHEFKFNKTAIPVQLGYYVYNPSNYDNVPYLRGGLKYYFHDQWFAIATVRAHGLNAEAIEWGLGIRI